MVQDDVLSDKAGLVFAGGLGDCSFYDSSNEGVEKAKEDLKGSSNDRGQLR